MSRLRIYLATIITILTSHCTWSQVSFEQLTTADGLPSDYVNCIFRDSNGYLWIATDKGVCRFDGKNFLCLNKDNGLTSNFVYCIAEDPQKNIWFGTFEGGLCKYDGHRITQLTLDPAEFKNIFKLVFNPDGSLFIISGRNHLFYLRRGFPAPERINCDYCLDLSFIEPGKFLIENYSGLFTLVEGADNRFSLRRLWTRRSDIDMVFSHLHGNRVIVQEGDSLAIYLVTKDSIVAYQKSLLPSSARKNPFWAYFTNEKELWIVTSTGIFYKNEDDESDFFTVEDGLGGLNYVKDIDEDNRHNLYISTYGGGVKIRPRLYLREYSVEGKVNSIFTGYHGTYITTTSGVYKYGPGRKCVKFKNLSFENFTSSFQSADGHFYLGTYSGFLKLPNESLLYTLNKSTENKYETPLWTGVSGFLSQRTNEVLVSSYGEGVLEFEQHDTNAHRLNATRRRISSGLVECLVSLKNSFAALSGNAGITLTTAADETITISKRDGLLSNSVYSVFQEKENEIWIGTLGGLNLYDGNKIQKTFSYNAGFIGSKVICIFRDSQQRFWVLSDQYLHLFDGVHLRPIRSCPLLYSKNSINRAEYDTASGSLYLGLTDAFVVVDVKKISPDEAIHLPRLVAVSDEHSTHSFTGKITLQSKDKIVFRFANQPYLKAEQSDIYYKLSGYSEEWKRLDYSGEISYQKLPPGQYELVARSVNPDYYVSPNTSLAKFEVLPPFWMRTWFILTSLIILLGAIFLASSRYSRKKYERKIIEMREQQKLQLERERIARELHDNVGSQLTYLINKIEDSQEILASKKEAGHLSIVARGAMRELRETIWALDKKEILPEELGNKIRQLLRLYENGRLKISSEWMHDNGTSTPLNSLQALNLYRIIQEALNNAVKYAKASDILITADFTQKEPYISIEDNGKGFDAKRVEEGYGLQNMKKRAEEMNAKLELTSEIGAGTCIKIFLNGHP